MHLGGLGADHAGAHRRRGLERNSLGVADTMGTAPEPLGPPQEPLPTFLRAFAASGACLTYEKDKLVCRGITASNETLNQMRGMSQQIKASASLPLGETIQCVLHILIRGPAVRMNPAAHSSESRIDTH